MKTGTLIITVMFLMLATGSALAEKGGGGNMGVGSNIPSGNNCAENAAYLQRGVDKYKEAVGKYPLNVAQLLESKDGKGPFVKVVPKCPSGNQYVIKNGTVKEAPKQ